MIHAWEVQEKIYKAFSYDRPINLAIHFIQNIMEFFVDRHCLSPQLARTEQTCQVKETHISQSRNLSTMTVTIFVFRWIDKYFNFHFLNHFYFPNYGNYLWKAFKIQISLLFRHRGKIIYDKYECRTCSLDWCLTHLH